MKKLTVSVCGLGYVVDSGFGWIKKNGLTFNSGVSVHIATKQYRFIQCN